MAPSRVESRPADSTDGLSPAFLELLKAEPLATLTVLDAGTGAGRPSRFAYAETGARRLLKRNGFVVEHLVVERDVKSFASVEEGLAAAVGLQEKWRADGRWFRYVKFLEDGGRTLTHAHLVVKARKA